MTKSKTFWMVTALLSLCITIFSGYSLYGRLSLHFSGDTLEVKTAPVPQLAEPEEEAAAEAAAVKNPPAETDKKPDGPEKTRAVKTHFEYKDPKAKTVSIAGSFSSWKDIRMTKKDGAWKTEVHILPGTYPYHFTVDGKKKTDPGKPSAPTGDSLITVAVP